MIPFRITFKPGIPIAEQVVFAAKKAIIGGQLPTGTPFPSVRALSKELKINPNTAHKVVAQLLDEELLEVVPGIGTSVRLPSIGTANAKKQLLRTELEKLVVEAKKLGIGLEDVEQALAEHWRLLENGSGGKKP